MKQGVSLLLLALLLVGVLSACGGMSERERVEPTIKTETHECTSPHTETELFAPTTPLAETEAREQNGSPEDDDRSLQTPVTGILASPEKAWTSISVTAWVDLETNLCLYETGGMAKTLRAATAEQVIHILATMDAIEVLTPEHFESQQSSPMFTIDITYADGSTEIISATELGAGFFRFTDTFGSSGDPGFVIGRSDELFDILSAYF